LSAPAGAIVGRQGWTERSGVTKAGDDLVRLSAAAIPSGSKMSRSWTHESHNAWWVTVLTLT